MIAYDRLPPHPAPSAPPAPPSPELELNWVRIGAICAGMSSHNITTTEYDPPILWQYYAAGLTQHMPRKR
ncbi:hypothetical protein E2C01_066085 [Portunus trituberculatus]|uniref:Uncharacterized protein n=1 Tax=Portunus trituberculatus TaxID=210409 RepID=A0A5B7HQ48_PORTR|nr:hypothetical protein [Portunus trituberculatus]